MSFLRLWRRAFTRTFLSFFPQIDCVFCDIRSYIHLLFYSWSHFSRHLPINKTHTFRLFASFELLLFMQVFCIRKLYRWMLFPWRLFLSSVNHSWSMHSSNSSMVSSIIMTISPHGSPLQLFISG